MRRKDLVTLWASGVLVGAGLVWVLVAELAGTRLDLLVGLAILGLGGYGSWRTVARGADGGAPADP